MPFEINQMINSINNDHDLKSELLLAAQKNEFILHYQPQFNLSTAKFEGVEALIRWQHPQRGLLMPGEFMPFAENDPELIIPLTEWVLKTACEQSRAWHAKGLPMIRVAVNVTQHDIDRLNFPEIILQILKKSSLAASCLEIELTENIIFRDEVAIDNIRKLKKIGVTIALDDFGTGYTSIVNLKKLPIDKIKIAKLFIDNVYSDNDDAAIVRAIIQLASTLNLQVVVEGVESLKQLQLFLTDKSIEFQGYYFSEPLPATEVEKFLMFYKNKQFL